MTALFIGLGAVLSTLIGGTFALRFKDRLHLILGFSAGAVIAIAFFELIPESIKLAGTQFGISTVTAVTAFGFGFYMILDRLIQLHAPHTEDLIPATKVHRGVLGAGSLSVHSFLDGVAIGIAFQVSATVGAIVAVAVLVHDFSDGINTVNLILKNKGTPREAFRWLATDAAAPMLGVLSTFFFTLSESVLGIVLASFAGFFLYIGASDLLPESYHSHPTMRTTLLTVLGAATLYAIIQIAG